MTFIFSFIINSFALNSLQKYLKQTKSFAFSYQNNSNLT
ncbi:hypothetical protein RCH33_1060 [Flavobacterium daejeonense]|nr:hypothetical protein RCH33_1060 [Flavobacterium daejeonense]